MLGGRRSQYPYCHGEQSKCVTVHALKKGRLYSTQLTLNTAEDGLGGAHTEPPAINEEALKPVMSSVY